MPEQSAREARARLAALYDAWGKPEQAARYPAADSDPVQP